MLFRSVDGEDVDREKRHIKSLKNQTSNLIEMFRDFGVDQSGTVNKCMDGSYKKQKIQGQFKQTHVESAKARINKTAVYIKQAGCKVIRRVCELLFFVLLLQYVQLLFFVLLLQYVQLLWH